MTVPLAVSSPALPRCIPNWDRRWVSTQIAVRLPEELVEFIDRLVADGRAPSRAAVVSQALQRERRRELAARDAAILASHARDEDMDALADHAARTPLDNLEDLPPSR
jgi:Arc/MetJ-type ribon-helix-helix transcriptional regulator